MRADGEVVMVYDTALPEIAFRRLESKDYVGSHNNEQQFFSWVLSSTYTVRQARFFAYCSDSAICILYFYHHIVLY